MNPADDDPKKPTTPHPTHSSSGGSKEAEAPSPVVDTPVGDVEKEEAKEAPEYVGISTDTADIPPDLQHIGVSTSPQDQVIAATPDDTSGALPLSDDQIGLGLKTKPTTSIRWLAEWCLRQLRKMHMHLKKVHGHFVRVKDST